MRTFFDTNVVLYALLGDDPLKAARAQELMAQHSRERTLVLSPQVLLETFNVLTRKRGVPGAEALEAVRLLATREVATPRADATVRALELAVRHGLSPWDAAIVQAALDAGCGVLLSEDMQGGRRIGALELRNPFAPTAHEPPAAMPRRR